MFWLVVDLPLWNIWKSVGMIISNIWKNKNVPSHQTNIYIYIYIYGGFQTWGIPKMDVLEWNIHLYDGWFRGTPISGNLHIYIYTIILHIFIFLYYIYIHILYYIIYVSYYIYTYIWSMGCDFSEHGKKTKCNETVSKWAGVKLTVNALGSLSRYFWSYLYN